MTRHKQDWECEECGREGVASGYTPATAGYNAEQALAHHVAENHPLTLLDEDGDANLSGPYPFKEGHAADIPESAYVHNKL